MKTSNKTFWNTGLFAIIIVAVLQRTSIFNTLPFVRRMLDKSGPPGFIAFVVVTVSIWTLLFVLSRRLYCSKELGLVTQVQRLADSPPGTDIDRQLAELPAKTLVSARLVLLRKAAADGSEHGAALMGGQASVDAASTQALYGPPRALIWSLPGLGFIGTASELAKSVGGLGPALARSTVPTEMRDVLIKDVIPYLGSAFDITLFALASSIGCFLLLSLVYAAEERLINEADAVSVRLMGRLLPARREASPLPPGLMTALGALTAACEQLHRDLVLFGDGWSKLADIDGTLNEIRENLSQEIVVTRRASPGLQAVVRDRLIAPIKREVHP